MAAVFVFLLFAILAGWVALVFRRERITLEEIYSRPGFVRMLWGIRVPLKVAFVGIFFLLMMASLAGVTPSREKAIAYEEGRAKAAARGASRETPGVKASKKRRDDAQKEVERIKEKMSPDELERRDGIKGMQLKRAELLLKMAETELAQSREKSVQASVQEFKTENVGNPPPRDFFGHQIGDDPLRGVYDEEGRIPVGRWCAGRP